MNPEALPQDLHETRSFFASRAAGWEDRFPDDGPVYAAAVGEVGFARGGRVIDLGCGTGRALPYLRDAVGPAGSLLGADVTGEMLDTALAKGRGVQAALVLCDAARLPVGPGVLDGIFAAGLITHVPDPHDLLRILAVCARAGCRLALFHPIGRAALARRHGRALRPDELLDPSVLPGALAATGWLVEHIDDADHRYLAVARLRRDVDG